MKKSTIIFILAGIITVQLFYNYHQHNKAAEAKALADKMQKIAEETKNEIEYRRHAEVLALEPAEEARKIAEKVSQLKDSISKQQTNKIK